ncbi:hypothetical protein [Burkholderia dolosa]|uniref:hypothetical protein n=1 Tax=Burkholderia dolosa TaxID=152500 RepID=UPI001B905DE2|nr:hypothetical protein [Burkholderia dolosa]MBR8060797.1 hypothetical protein [Burkholderia dolosa]
MESRFGIYSHFVSSTSRVPAFGFPAFLPIFLIECCFPHISRTIEIRSTARNSTRPELHARNSGFIRKRPYSANLKMRIYTPHKMHKLLARLIQAITVLYRSHATWLLRRLVNECRAGGRRQRLPGAIGTAAHGKKRIDAATHGANRIFDRGELNEGVRHGRSMAARSGRRSGMRGARMP